MFSCVPLPNWMECELVKGDPSLLAGVINLCVIGVVLNQSGLKTSLDLNQWGLGCSNSVAEFIP